MGTKERYLVYCIEFERAYDVTMLKINVVKSKLQVVEKVQRPNMKLKVSGKSWKR